MRRPVAHAIIEEFKNLKPGLILADLLVSALPRLCFCRLRTAIYRLAGISIGPGTSVLGRLTITGPGAVQKRLQIGADCIINSPLFFDLSADIRIGDRVSVGHHSVFVTAHHEIGAADYRAGLNVGRPITIGDGSWIAARSTLLPGVTVGESCIVASGAVVARDVPANSMVGGVPARLIRALES
jgi:acetyltransferase-like isoleucine patch superfamily enzyme